MKLNFLLILFICSTEISVAHREQRKIIFTSKGEKKPSIKHESAD